MWCKLHTLILSERPQCPMSMIGNLKCLKLCSFIKFASREKGKFIIRFFIFYFLQPKNYKPWVPSCGALSLIWYL